MSFHWSTFHINKSKNVNAKFSQLYKNTIDKRLRKNLKKHLKNITN